MQSPPAGSHYPPVPWPQITHNPALTCVVLQALGPVRGSFEVIPPPPGWPLLYLYLKAPQS
jgi:hypothetical protein